MYMYNSTNTFVSRKRGTLPITGRDGYLKDPTPSDEKKVKQELFTPVIVNPLASTERGKL